MFIEAENVLIGIMVFISILLIGCVVYGLINDKAVLGLFDGMLR